MSDLATESSRELLPPALVKDLEERRRRLAQVMARAIIKEVAWDRATGVPPSAAAITRACEAGLDLFLITAREGRPPTSDELRKVGQLGMLQARAGQSVEPVLAAYRVAARVAWDAILQAWRKHPDATPETMVLIANHVFAALDQVAAEVTRTYLVAREQHLERGTRARGRLFHALVSDTFDSDLALQKQALGLNVRLAPGYLGLVLRLVAGRSEQERASDELAQLVGTLEVPTGTLVQIQDPRTLALLWPADSASSLQSAADFVARLEEQVAPSGRHVRAGLGGYHPGLHGASRSYLESQQALETGRRVRRDAALSQYDEMVPYQLMAQQPLLTERFVRATLGPLLEPGRQQLLETLEAYLRTGSVKTAAERLGLHRHTVIYRLDKVREVAGVDLEQPTVRVQLQLALDLRQLV